MPDLEEFEPSVLELGAVLTTDASTEGEQCAAALRAAGFHVVEVPLSLLEARVIGEAPRVIVVDVDQPGAVDAVERLRELPAGAAAELVCVGDSERAAQLGLDPGSGRAFERPLDREGLLNLVAELARPVRREASRQSSPPSQAPRRDTAAPPFRLSEPPPNGSDAPLPSDSLEGESLAPSEGGFTHEPISPIGLSPELEQVLREAEERMVLSEPPTSDSAASAEDLLLAPELLALLDEPLDADDDDPSVGTGGVSVGDGTGTPRGRGPTTSAGKSQASGGSAAGTATGIELQPPKPEPARADSGEGTNARTNVGEPRDFGYERTPPPPRADANAGVSRGTIVETNAGRTALRDLESEAPPASRARTDARAPATRVEDAWDAPPRDATYDGAPPSRMAQPAPRVAPPPPELPRVAPPPPDLPRVEAPRQPAAAPLPAVLGDGDALRALARAISGRISGALALGGEPVVRRVVLREGDVVTAASGAPEETLVAFLVARGDLERDSATRLAGKLPPYGRHAGAALIAHGHLGQDDLWPVLRAHAEWLISRAVTSDEGTCELEEEPPGRLKAEPNVFGGATGAEVLVEIARRSFPASVALARLGGGRARLEHGVRASLLAECALRADEEELVRAAPSKTVAEAMANADPEIANVFYVLAMLDVLEVLPPARPPTDVPRPAVDPLDEEALRQRVRARASLVQEGDYFSLLGVGHAATGYEIRRAYLELRRGFEPARILTAQTADLADDVRLIVEVLDEAYDILREPARRDRYRRAIEAGPPA